ncbi:tetratricopeptide repeat protein [Chelativorans sp. Marseille-P2723]|uniref:tetratricopeptide repeat protein n=1 Tax=Chelativorans sp. Marseille-P2723 TaxID=2709133 RepID=UPI00156F3BB4|nr:tetratricopeptide repeat protein [Chelativorans sp. Marseille-P2723]
MQKLQVTVFGAAVLALSSAAGLSEETATSVQTVPTHSFSGAYLAGRAAEFDNDLESAISYYERAISYDRENTELQQSLLLTLISIGRFDDALPYAEKLKTEPQSERFSRLVLAVDAFRNQNYKVAERWLELVLESDLDRLITSIMTSWAKAGQGDFDSAIAFLEDLEGPEWYDLFTNYHRALLLAASGSEEEAGEQFHEVLENLAPRSVAPDTLGRIAHAYAAFLSDRSENEEALAVLERAVELGGGVASIEALRRKLEAGEVLEPTVTAPIDGAAEILLNIATELANGGTDSIVRLYLRYAEALRPEGDAILMQLAHVAERQQKGEEAIALYQKVPEDSPWARFASFQVGLNLADLDRKEEAIEHLKEVLDDDPTDMRAYLALGGVYASQNDFRSAAGVYERAVAQIETPERRHWNIFYQRGIAYERLKEWPKAEPNFRKALELFPDHPQVLNYLGYSWVDMNMNLDEAMELIRRAAELRPSDGYIIDSLGWAHYRLGEYEEAVEHLERAVSLRPEDPILNDHLGDAYWRVGRQLEARYQWSHARDLEPEPELLAEIEKKLENGLPPQNNRKLADAAGTGRNVISDSAAETSATPEEKASTDEEQTATSEEKDASGTAEETGENEGAESQPEAGAEAESRLYTVKAGQTLWSIAAEVLGDGGRFREILDLNPELRRDPNRIRPGQELRLPSAP